ncbi:sulfatase, partial [Candidatus Binatia bacterium]|nr:sulfatase [Candidatus Binatia bacterium]
AAGPAAAGARAADAPGGPALLAPGVDTPIGTLTRGQILGAKTYGIPAWSTRTVTSPPFVVPPGALLRLSLGVEDAAWDIDSAPVYFRVIYEDEHGATQDLFRRILDPSHNPRDRRWYDNDVDLSDLAGRTIRLRFVTEPVKADDPRPSLPVWGDPRVLAPAAGPRRPAIVLISLDTLRAKSMSLYGHARATTPFMTRLAARGTAFDNAFTTFSNTLGAHMSMLTGLLPATHDVRGLDRILADDRVLLAESLRRAGFATGAFTEDALLDSRRGFRRGFSAYYEDTTTEAGGGNAETTFGRALAWAAAHADEPFFLFVHTYQVHAPYDPPPAYRDAFPDDGAAKQQRRYEQEIRYLDDVLQRLVVGLQRLIPDDDLLLVVTADHGEEFLEHGYSGHVQLFDEVMHVPLLFVWSRHVRAGGRIAELVSLIDVAPTILQLAGVDAPPGMDGLSLVPLLTGSAPTLGRALVLGESPPITNGSLRQFVARSRDAKCMIAEGDAATRCYDLTADPDERAARVAGDDTRFAPLDAAVTAYRARSLASLARGHAPAPPDESIERKMRALGYVE